MIEDDRLPHLIFSLGNQIYALPITQVIEVAAMVELTQTPGSNQEFLGVANRHGSVLPILDLRPVFRQASSRIDVSTLFIVATTGDREVGLVVDEVLRIEHFEPEQIAQRQSSHEAHIQSIVSHNKQLIQVIDLRNLLAQLLPQAYPEVE